MRVLIVEDEPYLADAIRDGLRLEAIAADIAGDGHAALELLSVNAYDVAVLDRDIPGPSGDAIAKRIVASGSGTPILMLTAADRLDDKASGFELGADDYLTSRSTCGSWCSGSGPSTAGGPTTGPRCAKSRACVSIRSAGRSLGSLGHVPLLRMLRLNASQQPRGRVNEPLDSEIDFRIERELLAHESASFPLSCLT